MRTVRNFHWIPLLILLCLPRDGFAQLAANGKSLTVTTTNVIATFTGADLSGFHNQLTNENYLKNPSTGDLAAINTIASSGQVLQTSNWGIASEAGIPTATITASDSVRTLTLKVKIDAASQEIVVTASASITNTGLRDASWSIAGLDLGGGRLILPANSGSVYDNVTAQTTCPWFTTSSVPWIEVNSGSSAGGGTVSYSVSPNGGVQRCGVLIIAGKVFTVLQTDSNGVLHRRAHAQITSQ